MDGGNVRDLSSGNNGRDIKIRFFTRSFADAYRFVSETHMQGIAVCLRIDRDSAYAHFFAGTDDP